MNRFSHEKAKAHLNRLQIFNMCEVKSFMCKYQKYYYQLNTKTKEIYKDIFIDEFSYSLNTNIRTIWQMQPQARDT